ncbi:MULTISPECIES: iron-sulfur cluster repair di-iron protein [Haloferax]|uniref:Hemerythrin HHE cation binding region n=1 Tax=Haloferax mediterranei (strain ATCC 33500 / DSM 1411 / JCM 8866 / NBRC 14739 / NCIMB 2177 / R-4) TaxID=523841 RepID=M0JC13_HALMT|nr:Hemerythrin HHE cation binding region [Haloferax mediterranei ATCC 33500]
MITVTEEAFDPDRRVSSFVDETLAFAYVFEDFGIDYCCGGDVSLATACEKANVDIATIRNRLRAVQESHDEESVEWESLSELVNHIVSTHHDRLREELPSLESLVHKVAEVHGEDHPELRAVEREYAVLADEMRTHIEEEEDELFPIVRKLDSGGSLTDFEVRTVRRELTTFEDDHEATAERLEQLSELTDGYTVPDSACASYRGMLERLEALERETHIHVHKENNILFPTVVSTLDADA